MLDAGYAFAVIIMIISDNNRTKKMYNLSHLVLIDHLHIYLYIILQYICYKSSFFLQMKDLGLLQLLPIAARSTTTDKYPTSIETYPSVIIHVSAVDPYAQFVPKKL